MARLEVQGKAKTLFPIQMALLKGMRGSIDALKKIGEGKDTDVCRWRAGKTTQPTLRCIGGP